MADKKEPADRNSPTPDGKTGNGTVGGTAGEAASQAAPAEHPVSEIIEAFGGLRPMAGKLKVAVSTVQGWKERDSIPTARHSEILEAAKTHNIALDPAVLAASDHVARDQGAKSAPANNGSKDQNVKKDKTAPAAASGDSTKAEAPKDTAAKPGTSAARSGIPASGSSKTPEPEKAAVAKAAGGDGKKAETKPADSKASPPKSLDRKPEPASNPVAKTGGKSGGLLPGFIVGVVVLALVLAGVVYSRSAWLPLVEGLPVMAGGESGSTQGAEASAEQIAALEEKLLALEAQLQSAPAPEAIDLTPLDEAIAAANARIDVLDGTLEQLLAGGVIIAPEGGDTAAGGTASGSAAPGAALDSQELAALKAQVEALAGQMGSGDTAAGTQSSAGAVSQLNTRLDDLEAKLAALPDPAARLDALDSRLSATEQGVAGLPALETRLSAELAALNEALPKGPSEEAGDAAMFLALLQLRQALSGSGSFQSELALVEGLAAGDADLTGALAPLSAHAGSGIAALPGLQASFGEMAAKVVAAGRGGEEGDWVGKTLQKVSEIVTVRPVGLVEGDDPGAVLARAEVKLEAGDLAAAVAELDALTGAAAEGAAAWRQEATARLDAEKALSLLATRAATLVGLGG